MPTGKFEFKGSGGSYLWLVIWTTILTVITVGIFYPWAYCTVEKWRAKNTYIDQKQLVFKGSGGGIFGTWLLVVLLSIITVGIYYPWGYCRIQRWKTNNLYFAEAGDIEQT
jgi:uncharacterized membrane protein YjgN (DUF898 family)